MRSLSAWAPEGIPEVRSGADLAALIIGALRIAGIPPADGDVLVVAQKVVSKAEGSVRDLAEVAAGDDAQRLARLSGKDARLVQVILDESRAILRVRPGLVIAEHRLGYVCANAGVDHSNVGLGESWVCLLPQDPDASAAAIRRAVGDAFGVDAAVVINDSHGRPFREGTVGVAIGSAGLEPLLSFIGQVDRSGYTLRASVEAVADELAAAASLLQGQAAEGTPLVVIRGARYDAGTSPSARLLRVAEKDMFR
ncbi:MAG TPA: coenzyme F420-0:L-glutamate ligase [bacterium]|jgi:coenzyme F420-0:L-glutamate ligase/coenzyme F420-1:gamma-L-glutamate ligase|nr:coenzyme F420-0:L-glutamate ligase [bacterium]